MCILVNFYRYIRLHNHHPHKIHVLITLIVLQFFLLDRFFTTGFYKVENMFWEVNNPIFWNGNIRGDNIKWMHSAWGFLSLFLFCHFPDPSHQEIQNHSVRVTMGMGLVKSKPLPVGISFCLGFLLPFPASQPLISRLLLNVYTPEIYIFVQDKLHKMQHFSPLV